MFPQRRDDPYLVDIRTGQGFRCPFTRYGCGAQSGRTHQAFDFRAVDPGQPSPRIQPVPREFYIRTTIDGHEFDLQSWFRFFDLLERRDNVWRIVKRTAVYEKDRLEPVDPRGVPKDFFADMNLSTFPASAKFLCYRQVRSGRSPSTNIISVYTDEERALREEGERWLENA